MKNVYLGLRLIFSAYM